MSKLHLILVIHAHQPAGNFGDVLERAYSTSYLPFAELLHKHPSVRVALHYTGPLLEWIEQHHPEFFDLMRELVGRDQVELIGGGFYEPILISIPSEDRMEQIHRLADYIEKHFGKRPKGAWLAERVWEPQLPGTLEAAGVDYTLVDDIHFLAAGFEPGQLHGYYLAEDQGAKVKLIPGLKALRYLVPFRSVEDNIDFLSYASRESPGGFVAMGDDNEKFGVWPKTYEHCYQNGWLEKYFCALEENADWLETTLPGAYLGSHPPLGRADLPAASYTEMMEWALPNAARQKFHAVSQEFAGRPEVATFLRGGIWRNFFTKYGESNLLHKRMLNVSAKVKGLRDRARQNAPIRETAEAATTHLLRSQCNDAYWHGVFGGLYSPHLRTELLRELVCAEKLADTAEAGRAQFANIDRLDYDADGREEIYLTSDVCAALWKPSDGGTLAALDYRPNDVTLINSLQRRPEVYHARLGKMGDAVGGVESIHEQIKVKEPGLERRIRYDRWPRHSFRLLLFPANQTWDDYEGARLEADAAIASGDYQVSSASADRVEMFLDAPIESSGDEAGAQSLRVEKKFELLRWSNQFELNCELKIRQDAAVPLRMRAGLEIILNFLAPNEPDRYFEVGGTRLPLSLGATAPSGKVRLADEWQNVEAVIDAENAREYWITPIETVSESEEGFERVYQGSQILAVWPLELEAGATWKARLRLHIGSARPSP
ncbi:MAG: DUF1926 domain-containing protein [Acidobacteria bacterium]|nr:DUF1926 domain-containing protein [Acidobacteriota bacterium]